MKFLKEKSDQMKNTLEIMVILEIERIPKKNGPIWNIEREDLLQEKIKIGKGKFLKKVEITKFIKVEIIKEMIKNIIQKEIIEMIMIAKNLTKNWKNWKISIITGEEEIAQRVIEKISTDIELKEAIVVKEDIRDTENVIQVKRKFILISKNLNNKKMLKMQICCGMDSSGSLNQRLCLRIHYFYKILDWVLKQKKKKKNSESLFSQEQ